MHAGERFNGYSALAGAVLAVTGTAVLVVMASLEADPWRIVSFSVYGATLVLVYVVSTLYHGARDGRAKDVLRRLDHCSIYLLIAGTYTPFTLVTLNGPWGWSLFGAVWGLAAVGIVQEWWFARGKRVPSIVIYVLMGWLAVVALAPLFEALAWKGMAWVVGGGLLYTVGIVFYAYDKRVRHFHGVWHLFVLGGSAAHFIAMVAFVA